MCIKQEEKRKKKKKSIKKKWGVGGGCVCVAAVCVPVQKWPVCLRAGCRSGRSPDKVQVKVSRGADSLTFDPLATD